MINAIWILTNPHGLRLYDDFRWEVTDTSVNLIGECPNGKRFPLHQFDISSDKAKIKGKLRGLAIDYVHYILVELLKLIDDEISGIDFEEVFNKHIELYKSESKKIISGI